MRLKWSQQSLKELETVRQYIEKHNPAAANRVRDRIIAALERLAPHPFIGRVGRIPNTREFVFTDIPYVSVYEIDEANDQVTIIRVIHTSRFYPPEIDE